jgi:hypothetical protein
MEKGLMDGDGKGNLEINYELDVFKCWSCSDVNGTHGTINKLIRKYGNRQHLKRYKLLRPETIHKRKENDSTIEGLPREFKPLSVDSGSYDYIKAIEYLEKRNIKLDEIIKFKADNTDEKLQKRILENSTKSAEVEQQIAFFNEKKIEGQKKKNLN